MLLAYKDVEHYSPVFPFVLLVFLFWLLLLHFCLFVTPMKVTFLLFPSVRWVFVT